MNNRKFSSKKKPIESKTYQRSSLIRLIAPFVLLVHGIYVFFLYAQVPIDSDFASQTLIAQDILSGNWALHGWNLTGVTFYTTELPFYALSVRIFGVSVKAYIAAASLMYFCLSLAAFSLLHEKNRRPNFSELALFLAICGMPTLEWLGFLRGHSGAFIYFFILLGVFREILARDKENSTSSLLYLLFFALLAIGCMGDMLLLLIVAAPVALYCLINLLRADNSFRKRTHLLLTITTMVGCACGWALDSGFQRFGQFNKNSFLSTRKFLRMDIFFQKLSLLAEAMLKMFKADFSGKPLFDIKIIAWFVFTLVLLFALYLVARTLIRFLKNPREDPVSVVLSLSFVLMLLICFVTDIFSESRGIRRLESARYLAFMPFSAAILIIRQTRRDSFFEIRLAGGGISTDRAALIVSIMCIALQFTPVSWARAVTPQDRLALFLEENGLEYGYSDFWNASHTTVASENRIKVRAVKVYASSFGVPAKLLMQNWYCKTEWYEPPFANYFVFDGNGYLDVHDGYIQTLVGKPDRILETEGYKIFVYDRNIASDIEIDGDAARSE